MRSSSQVAKLIFSCLSLAQGEREFLLSCGTFRTTSNDAPNVLVIVGLLHTLQHMPAPAYREQCERKPMMARDSVRRSRSPVEDLTGTTAESGLPFGRRSSAPAWKERKKTPMFSRDLVDDFRYSDKDREPRQNARRAEERDPVRIPNDRQQPGSSHSNSLRIADLPPIRSKEALAHRAFSSKSTVVHLEFHDNEFHAVYNDENLHKDSLHVLESFLYASTADNIITVRSRLTQPQCLAELSRTGLRSFLRETRHLTLRGLWPSVAVERLLAETSGLTLLSMMRLQFENDSGSLHQILESLQKLHTLRFDARLTSTPHLDQLLEKPLGGLRCRFKYLQFVVSTVPDAKNFRERVLERLLDVTIADAYVVIIADCVLSSEFLHMLERFDFVRVDDVYWVSPDFKRDRCYVSFQGRHRNRALRMAFHISS